MFQHIIKYIFLRLYLIVYNERVVRGCKRRKEVGLTEEDFTHRAKVTLTIIRKIEKNNTNFKS